MPKKPGRPGPDSLSRRGFLRGVGAAGGAAAVGLPAFAEAPSRVVGADGTKIRLNVNGTAREVEIEPRVTLLDALRNRLDLTGAKKICDRGACGGCTVLVDGLAVNSCLMLAIDADGRKVQTVEGLSPEGGPLSPLQQAFCDHDALQCGFCTPGMVMSCKALLDRTPEPSLEQIREGIAGNICRCGTYNRIFDAVRAASKK